MMTNEYLFFIYVFAVLYRCIFVSAGVIYMGASRRIRHHVGMVCIFLCRRCNKNRHCRQTNRYTDGWRLYRQRFRGDPHPVLFVDDLDVLPFFLGFDSGLNLASMAGEHPISTS